MNLNNSVIIKGNKYGIVVVLDKDVSFVELESKCGHDAFLLEFEKQTKIIKSFLRCENES